MLEDEPPGSHDFSYFCVLHLRFLLPLLSIPPQGPPHHMTPYPRAMLSFGRTLQAARASHTLDTCLHLLLLRQVPQPRRPSFPISASWYASYPSVLPLPLPYSIPRPPRSKNQPLTLLCVHSILYPSLFIKVSYSQSPSYIRNYIFLKIEATCYSFSKLLTSGFNNVPS